MVISPNLSKPQSSHLANGHEIKSLLSTYMGHAVLMGEYRWNYKECRGLGSTFEAAAQRNSLSLPLGRPEGSKVGI